jgi:hypothetical protein
MGETSHVSPLWKRVQQLCDGPEERIAEWLLKCAILRGAAHYNRPFPADLPPDNPALNDEEIGVALCLGQHPYNSVYIRAAAQLLSSPRIDAVRLAHLGKMERVERVLRHIARVAERFDPRLEPWAKLRDSLNPRGAAVSESALPHWSRFVSHTGVSIGGGLPETQWLRRREKIR